MKLVVVTLGGLTSTGLGNIYATANFIYNDLDLSPAGTSSGSTFATMPCTIDPDDFLDNIAAAVRAECLAAFAPGGYNPMPGSDGIVVVGEMIVTNPPTFARR